MRWLAPLMPSQLLQYGPDEMQGAGHADEAWGPASALKELGGSNDQVPGERPHVLAPDHHGLPSGTQRRTAQQIGDVLQGFSATDATDVHVLDATMACRGNPYFFQG
uniref:Uncharacterized protein n=1 Tax=Zea mays TaxID=4577 RepID=A0A804N5R0_MAIZE